MNLKRALSCRWFFIFALTSCATRTESPRQESESNDLTLGVTDPGLPKNGDLNEHPNRKPVTLQELQKAESKDPNNPSIKLKLGHKYWCAGNKAFAVEHWNWVLRFDAPESPFHEKAKLLMSKVNSSKENALTKELCQ